MRQSINKHYDTLGGFSAILANVSSHIKAPPVSLKEDETMKQTKISLIDFMRISTNKVFKSYPKCNGKTRFGIKIGGGTWGVVWAINEETAFEIALKDFSFFEGGE